LVDKQEERIDPAADLAINSSCSCFVGAIEKQLGARNVVVTASGMQQGCVPIQNVVNGERRAVPVQFLAKL
jgi:hypothetical protein